MSELVSEHLGSRDPISSAARLINENCTAVYNFTYAQMKHYISQYSTQTTDCRYNTVELAEPELITSVMESEV